MARFEFYLVDQDPIEIELEGIDSIGLLNDVFKREGAVIGKIINDGRKRLEGAAVHENLIPFHQVRRVQLIS